MIDSDILDPQDWTFPVPVVYGPGRLSEIGVRCRALGVRSPLIVTDRNSRDLPFVNALLRQLSERDLQAKTYCGISPNPRDDEIALGRAAFQAGNHDAVIAIGGGSAMDGGKAICLTANNQCDIWDFEFGKLPSDISSPFPTLVTIPTTAGTGAETESTAMVTHVEGGMKLCVWHPELKPSLAVLDPELSAGLPRDLTAWTGLDALVHAIEAYLVFEPHTLCDAMALEALALISRWLPVAVDEPDNLTARGGMLLGACLAGIAFLKGLGLVHAISHMVGAEFDTHHGLTNAIVLPVVLRFNLPEEAEKTARMAQAMGLRESSPDALIAHIERMLDSLDIPRSLSEIGVTADCTDRIADKAILDDAAGTNPRAASLNVVAGLVRQSIVRAR